MAYTVSATIKGSRDGECDDAANLVVQGCSACFSRAVAEFAKKHDLRNHDVHVTCQVTMDEFELSFGFKVDLHELPESAEKVGAYSRAKRNDAPVTVTVV